MASSLPQPLCHVLVSQLHFQVRWAGAGELVSAVGVAEVTPQASEFWWDVIVSVFLCNHLLKKKKKKKFRLKP